MTTRCCDHSTGQSFEVTTDTCLPTRYPMFVVRIVDSLAMSSLSPHQELLTSGTLYLFQGGMVVVFVSHQWMGIKYPDIRFRQFKELQMVLKGLIDNTVIWDV